MEKIPHYLAGFSVSANQIGLPFSTQTIPEGIANIVGIIVTMTGALSVVMLIVGGLLYTTSSGDPGRTKRARETITYSIVGLIISIVAFAVVVFIAKALK